MEKGTREIKIPDGVKILAELGDGLVIAEVDINLIREQDKNAHMMKPEMFRQLAENIKNRGMLESLPFCALTDKIEIVSGHHRIRAAKEAGLKTVPIILDISGLTRSQIAAKQIAHNAINGFDDPSMLKEIAKLITDVNDMIESYIGKDILGEPLAELDKLISPKIDYDWKQIAFLFLPFQIKDLEELVKRTAGNTEFMGVSHREQYDQMMDALIKYQNFKNVKNIGAAIHSMIKAANEEMAESGYDSKEQWIPLSRLFGAAAIPESLNELLKKVFDKMKKERLINDKTRWKALEILADSYLNR